MNGKSGSVGIGIGRLASNAVLPEFVKKCSDDENSSPWKWIWDVWKFAKEDTNRVTFSLKVGLACLLVSLFILFRAPYQVFGANIVWSILTVAIMFEYTVGMYRTSPMPCMHACMATWERVLAASN